MSDAFHPDHDIDPDATAPLGDDDLDAFDLDAWIDGAVPTRRSVTVYGKAHLVARKDELEAELRALDSARVRAVGGDDDGQDDLRREWQDVMNQITGSKLTVTVQALSQERIDAATKAYRKRHKIESAWGASRDPEVWARFDAAGQERYAAYEAVVSPAFTSREQYDRFMEKIGPAQADVILDAWRKAMKNAAVVVSTDFSPRTSDDDDLT